jgi:hypothetical protein
MSVDPVWLLGIPLPTFFSVLPSLGDILRVLVFHHHVLKKDLSTSLFVAADQCIDGCNKVGREPMLKRNIVTKIRRKHDYNQTVAKGEKRKQDVLQVVENNRKRVKITSKKELGTYETL